MILDFLASLRDLLRLRLVIVKFRTMNYRLNYSILY